MADQQLDLLNALYQSNPSYFSEEDISLLQTRNEQEDIPFQKIEDTRVVEDNLWNTVSRGMLMLHTGMLEGFTTLPVNDWVGLKPRNTAEQLFSSIGQLMGFIGGFIPGPGLLGKLGLTSAARGISMLGRTAKAAKIASEGKYFLQLKSLPMMGADLMMKGLNKATGGGAALEAVKFLGKGTVGRNLLGGGLHLGFASGIASAPIYDLSWDSFVDRRLEGAIHGGIFGAGNRAIGNLIGRGGKLDLGKVLFKGEPDELIALSKTGSQVAAKTLKNQDKINMFARALSSSLFFGMPSTLQDYPLELQVYEYLLNAYFGAKEMPLAQRTALELSRPFASNPVKRDMLLRPEKHIPNYDNLPDAVKNELQIQAEFQFGGTVNEFYNNTELAAAKTVDKVQQVLETQLNEGKINQKQYGELFKNWRINQVVEQAAKEGKTEEEVQQKITEKTEQLKDQLAEESFIKSQYEELMNSVLNKDLGDPNLQHQSIVQGNKELDDFYQQSGLARPYREPFREISKWISNKKGILIEDVASQVEIEKAVIKEAQQYLGKKDAGEAEWNSFKENIAKQANAELDDNITRELRRTWVKVKQSEQRLSLSVKADNSISEPSVITPEGLKRVPEFAPRPIMADLLIHESGLTTLREIKNYEQKDGTEIDIYRAIDEGLLTDKDLILKAYNTPLYANQDGKVIKLADNTAIYGGRKDEPVLLSGRFLIAKEDANRVIEEARPYVGKDYQKGLERFGIADKEAYDHIYANNIEMLRQFNGFDTVRELFEAKGKFITDPIALTKRFQVFNDHSPKLEPGYMKDIDDNFKFIILNARNSDGTFHSELEGSEYTFYAKDKDKKVQLFKYDAHLDGGVFVRDDVYNKMVSYFGYDTDTSSAKGVHIFKGDSGEPAIVDGYTRLWRGETSYEKGSTKVPDWVKDANKDKPRGIFFSASKEEANYYDQKFGNKSGNISYIDVPTADIEAYRASNNGGKQYTAQGMAVKEFFLPEELGEERISYKNNSQGGFIGKLAWHKASPELTKWMTENNIHAFHFDTTAKQRGARESADWQMKDGQFIFPKGFTVYDSPWESVSVNSAEDIHGAVEKYQKIAKTVSTNIDGSTELGRKAQKSYIDNFVKPKIYSSPEVSREIAGAIDLYSKNNIAEADKIADKIDIDSIGMQDKIRILNTTKVANKLWKKIVDDILNIDPVEDDLTYFDGIIENETLEYKDDFIKAKGTAQRYLDAIGDNLTPQLLQLPGIREYYEAALKRYFIEHTITPRTKYSAKLIFTPHDPFVTEKLGGIKPGYYYANDGLKSKIIPTSKGEMTLEEAYKAVPDELEHMFVRVPTSSASGVRLLKFGGFTDTAGYGFKVHPEEYFNMDGADNDIDSAFVYFDMPKEIKDYYRAQRDQWYEKAKYNGKDIKVSKEAKQNPEFLDKENTQPLYKFDPISYLEVNKSASQGKEQLGYGMSTGNRLKAIYDMLMNQKRGYLFGYTKNGEVAWRAKINKDRNIIEDLVRDVVNYSADAADGNKLKDKDQVQSLLFKKFFTNIESKDKKGIWRLLSPTATNKFTNNEGKEITYRLFNLKANPEYAAMMKLDSAAKGKEYRFGRPAIKYKFEDIIKIFKDYRETFENKIPNTWYGAMHELGTMEYQYKGISGWLGGRTNLGDWLQEFTEKWNKKLIRKYVGRFVVSTPKENLLKQRQLFIDRHRHLYGETPLELQRLNTTADRYESELAAQDLYDNASALYSIRTGAVLDKVVDGSKSITEIQKKVAEFQRDLGNIRKAKKNNTDYIKNDGIYNTDKLSRDVTEYYKTLTNNQPGKDYFEALLSSSLHIQEMSLAKYIEKEIRELKSVDKDSERARELRDIIKYKSKEWKSTNADTFFMNLDVISANTMKNIANVFQKLSDVTFQPVDWKKAATASITDAGGLAEVIGDVSREKVVIQTDTAKAKELVDSVDSILKRKSAILEAGKDKVLNAELESVNKVFQDILIRKPFLIANLEDRLMSFGQERWGIAKPFKALTLPEYKSFVRELARLDRAKTNGMELDKSDYYWIPERFDAKHRQYDYGYTESVIKYWNGEGIKEAVIREPLSRMGKNTRSLMTGAKMKDEYVAAVQKRILEDSYISKIQSDLNRQIAGSGDDLFSIAIARRESGLKGKVYKDNLRQADKLFNEKYKDKKFNLSKADGSTVARTADEIINGISAEVTRHAKEAWKLVFDKAVMEKWISPYSASKMIDNYQGIDWLDTEKAIPQIASKFISGSRDIPFVTLNGIDRLIHSHMAMHHNFSVFEVDPITSAPRWVTRRAIDLKLFTDRVNFLNARAAETTTGEITLPNGEKQVISVPKYAWLSYRSDFTDSEVFREWQNHYWPHRDIPKKFMEQRMQEELVQAQAANDLKTVADIRLKYARAYGDDILEDAGRTENTLSVLEGGVTEKEMTQTHFFSSPGSLMNRDKENPLPGYSTKLKAWVDYETGLASTYWNKLTALVTDWNIRQFTHESAIGKNDIGKENAVQWERFMRNTVREVLGYPSRFPDSWIDDPGSKIKGHPYYWLTNDYWLRKGKMADKFFGVDKNSPQAVKDAVKNRKLAALSNVEGKAQMMSLLFSPKSFLTNLITANINTVISAGWRFRKMASDLALLKSINPKWQNWSDIERDIDLLGGIESFIRNEAALSQRFTSEQAKRFMEKAIAYIKKDKNLNDKSLYEIAKEEGLTEEFVNTGAYFMRKSERMGRRAAWLSHYLKAREVLEASNYAFEWDDPWLISFANKGVNATQFLYNSSNRPAFTRTSLGKIFTRFQLFAYNSVMWRKDIVKQAAESGWNYNSPEYQKFQRMATADLFVMTLATLLPASLFNAALPPPYNYLKDFTSFLFGDKEEQEKAFFGILPYPANVVQPIFPPASRYFTSTFSSLMTGDWDKFTGYHIWSWMPFGRVMNDARRGLDNPAMFMERNFGIPVITLATGMSKAKKNSEGKVNLSGLLFENP
jgi:hypothetical protein